MQRLKIATTLLVLTLSVAGQKTSLLGGEWSLLTTWLPLGAPGPNDNVVISGPVTIASNAVCNNITINSGGSISFSGSTARILNAGGNIVVNSGGIFQVLSTSNTIHTLELGGNLTANGNCDFRTDGNSRVILRCTAAGNQTISGTGSLRIFSLSVDKGNNMSGELVVSINSITAVNNFLDLKNGTLRLQPVQPCTLTAFTALDTIPSTAAIWVNAPSVTLFMNDSVVLAGKLEVSDGNVRVGNAGNENLISTGGTVCVNGGSLAVAGSYHCATASTFSFSSGTFLVPLNNTTNTLVAPFDFTAPGSSFYMTGGNIILRREGGGGAPNLGMINTGASTAVATGGTLQIGESTTPNNQVMNISSSVQIPNLVVADTNARAAIAPGTLTVVNVAVQSGSLLLQSGHLVVTGDYSDYGGLSSGTGTLTFRSNAAQTISAGIRPFNTVIFEGTGIKTFSTDVFVNGTFSVAPSGTVDVSTNNRALSLRGGFVNNGTFLQRSGNVSLAGNTNQQISGSTKTTFFDLTLSNSAGATLQTDIDLEGALHITGGNLNVNGKVFTLLSGPATNARIAAITGGNISGDITMQRYVPAGYTGWAFLGAPFSSGVTLAQWDDDAYITCSTCPDGFMNFNSVCTYDETASGGYNNGAGYVPLGGLSDPVTPGKGFWIYLGNAQTHSTAFLMDVTGPPQKFTTTIPLNYTDYNTPADDGWNLIANPYPSPISWQALHNDATDIDDAIYIYNADLASGAGGYAAYVNGISSPMPAAGGIGDEIPAWQGFYVHSTGATSLVAQESIKTGGSQPLLSSVSSGPTLRLTLTSGNQNDEAVLYCSQGATNGFDKRYDAYKLGSSAPLAAAIALETDSAALQINGVPFIAGVYTTAISARCGYQGNYTIQAIQLTDFPPTSCITLFDRFTQNTTDLRKTGYVIALPDTSTIPRFILTITNDSLAINSLVTQPTCASPDKGTVVAKPSGNGPWDYKWTKNGSIIRNVNGSNGPDSLVNVAGGLYVLSAGSAAECASGNVSFSLTSQVSVSAQFFAPATATLLNGTAVITLTNNSINASATYWTFDQTGSNSFAFSPVHTYTAAGIHTVLLVASSETGCTDTARQVIIVYDDLVTRLIQPGAEKCFNLYRNGKIYHLQNNCDHSVEVRLSDATGRTLRSREVKAGDTHIIGDGDQFPPGVYYLIFDHRNGRTAHKVIFD